MSRSVKKGPFVAFSLLKKIDAMNASEEKKIIKTWSRASTILPSFVGHTIAIHDGTAPWKFPCMAGHLPLHSFLNGVQAFFRKHPETFSL